MSSFSYFDMKVILIIFCFTSLISCIFLEGYVETDDHLQTVLDDLTLEVMFDGYHISLRNEMGTLIDETFCDPFGYFIFHLDNINVGKYMVQVDARGVSFDTGSIKVDVSDIEKSSRPVRFLVTGFSIFGNVRERFLDGTKGNGPDSLPVKLVNEDGKERVVSTEYGGEFEFDNVQPGEYVIEVEAVDQNIDCLVGSGPVDIENDRIVIEGYVVKGRVKDCSKSIVLQLSHELVSWKEEVTPSCEFSFEEVPSGEYKLSVVQKDGDSFKISPEYIYVRVKGDVHLAPNSEDYNFELTGITVSGKVINPLTNKPVFEAEIKVDGSVLSKTLDDGSFRLVDIGTGSIDIEVSKDDLKFMKLENVFIHPNEPFLPEIHLSHCKICGKLEDEFIRRQVVFESRVLEEKKVYKVFTDEGSFCKFLPIVDFERFSVRVASLDKESEITDYPQVDYSIVDFIDTKEKKIIKFGKNRYDVDVKIHFLETVERKSVKVTIEPIVDSLIVAKKMKEQRQRFLGRKTDRSSDEEENTVLEEVVTREDHIQFTGLLLGRYKVNVFSESYCFSESSIVVLVVGEGSVVELYEKGVKANFRSTFLDSLSVVVEGTGTTKVDIPKGESSICLSSDMFKNDKITITPDPEGCFEFEEESVVVFDFFNPVELIVYDKPDRYMLDFHIKLGKVGNNDSILLSISSSVDGFEKSMTLRPSSVDVDEKERSQLFLYGTTIENDAVLKVRPISENYLFTPSEYEYRMIESTTPFGCPRAPETIIAETGVFFEGKVTKKTNSKPLESVRIKVYNGEEKERKEEENESLVVVLEGFTNEKGEFRIGPLRNNPNYLVEATLDTFVLTRKEETEEEENVIRYSFFAEELSTLQVVVEHESKSLKDVLVSVSSSSKRTRSSQEPSQVLSSDPIRSHGLTDENGEIVMKNLYPGEYYIKVGLREYEFELIEEGSSTNVHVKDQIGGSSNFMIVADLGSTEESGNTVVKIKATRFEFSAFGVVQSLNMKPVIHARVAAEKSGMGIVEEGITDSKGEFRIKGLIPGENYKISVLSETATAQPEFYEIAMKKEDLTGIDFIDFSRYVAPSETDKFESSFYGLLEISENERHEFMEKGSSYIEQSVGVKILNNNGKVVGETTLGLGRTGLATFSIPCEPGQVGKVVVDGWVVKTGENLIEEGKFKHVMILSSVDGVSSGKDDVRPFFGTALLVIFLVVFRLILVSQMEE